MALPAIVRMNESQDHAAERLDPFRLHSPNLRRTAMQQMNQRVILRHGVRQLDQVGEKKGKHAASSARLRLVRIRIREAAVEIEVESGYPFGPPQRRGRAEAIQTVLARPLLEQRSELAEVA